jgi:hypothetical protein
LHFFFDGLASSSFFDFGSFTPFLTLGPRAFICFFFKTSSVSLSDGILQNSFPRLLIAREDNVGGSTSQQRQLLGGTSGCFKTLIQTLQPAASLDFSAYQRSLREFSLEMQIRVLHSIKTLFLRSVSFR